MTNAPASPPAKRQHFDVQQEIKELILQRKLPPGALLPPEPELMAALGVSRSSIREALKGLQSRSIVSIEHGRGTFVGRPSMEPFIDTLVFHRHVASRPDDLDAAVDLVDIRDILETALVQRVAAVAGDELLGTLEETVTQMEGLAEAGKNFDLEDRRFHQQLYAPLRNRLVIQLVAAFWDVLEAVRPMLARREPDPVADAQQHRLILERIRGHDPAGAAVAMHEHFRATHLWVEQATTPDQ